MPVRVRVPADERLVVQIVSVQAHYSDTLSIICLSVQVRSTVCVAAHTCDRERMVTNPVRSPVNKFARGAQSKGHRAWRRAQLPCTFAMTGRACTEEKAWSWKAQTEHLVSMRNSLQEAS